MTHVATTRDLAARWRLALPAAGAAVLLAARDLRLWPFLGALVLLALWTGFAAGRRQARGWRRAVEATLDAGTAQDAEIDVSPGRPLPPVTLLAAAALLCTAVTGTGGGAALAVLSAGVAAAGGWSFGRGTALAALEADRGWTLHWPAGSSHRPGVPRLVAVSAERVVRRRRFRWGLAAGATVSLLAAALAVGTLAAVRAYATRPLPSIAAPSSRSRIEPTLGRVASTLAGHPVEVRCWSAADWPRVTLLDPVETGGFADLAAGTVNLPPSVCRPLDTLAYSPAHVFAQPTWERIAAVHVLAHEAAHLGEAGANEARAECDAVQTTERAAVLLGVAPDYAGSMAQLDWAHLYPRLPSSYRTLDCRPGGPLDLHLAEGWPGATPAGP
jgi:hypothetical protein